MLGIRGDQVEDALKSERAARATLSRRGLLALGASAGASLATGTAFSFFEPPAGIAHPLLMGAAVEWSSLEVTIGGQIFTGFTEIEVAFVGPGGYKRRYVSGRPVGE
jgi:hypothetical protein